VPEIYRGDLYGLREHKYGTLGTTGVTDTEWAEAEPTSPFYLFAEADAAAAEEYEKYYELIKAMPLNAIGFQSHRDKVAIGFSRGELETSLSDFLNGRVPIPEDDIHLCLYRPFDYRYGCFSKNIMDRPRLEVSAHLFKDNLALNTMRQTKATDWRHSLVADAPSPAVYVEIKDGSSMFPLYLYPSAEEFEGGNRHPNLSPEFVESFLATVDAGALENSAEVGQRSGSREILYPEDIFYYIYGVLHSPTYRERYAEFLKLDFPRIPLPKDYKSFDRLAAAGQRLAELHLLKNKDRWGWQGIEQRGDAKEAVVGKVEYDEKNEEIIFDAKKPPDERYRLGPVPVHIWEFHVGGYQVLNKWLKDRKGRKVAPGDYVAIIIALTETDRIMKEECDPAFREMLGI
jgi:predicted helicase